MDDEQRCQERTVGLPEVEEGGAERRKEGGAEGGAESNQPQDSQRSQSSDPAPPGKTDAGNPGELPQRMLGNKKVDDMRFMISCTNWY